VNVTLADVARGWAEKMRVASVAVGTEDCLISHNPNLRTAVPLKWKKLGENVGCGDVGVEGLHAAFVNSPKHYANIIDPAFDSIGIGIVYAGDVMFVTEQFMDADESAGSATVPGSLALAAPKQGTSKVLSASAVRPTRRRPTTTKHKRT
jgi:Cysteine-rich secretory protein family